MIKRVWFENLGPFRARVDLNLANQGFVLIRGRNMISSALDANGVGKTSIPNGISWIAFGEDLNGRKADAVANRFTDGQCIGGMELEDDKGPWTIERTRRPAGLRVTGIEGIAENEDMAVTQERIEQRLGFGLRTFKNAIVFGQNTLERFATAGQAEQMRMLDEIQGIDFSEELKRAKIWRTDLQGKVDTLNADGAARAGRRATIERSITALETTRQRFEVDRTDRLTKLGMVKDGIEARRVTIERALREAADSSQRLPALLQAKKAVEAALMGASQLQEAQRASQALYDRAHDRTETAKKAEYDFTQRLNKLLGAGQCPTCRQQVTATTLGLFKPEIDALAAKTTEATTASEAAYFRADTDRKQMEQAKKNYTDALAKLTAACGGLNPESYIASLTAVIAQGERRKTEATQIDIEVAQVNADIDQVNSAVWSGQEELNSLIAQARDLEDQAKIHEGRAVKLAQALAMADYWVEAFGDRGIRSVMVDSVADYVNDRVRNHLEILAGGEATTVMSATTDLKKGGTKEKISFKTVWAWGGDGPADGSGGQDRRKDLALFAAMQDLAESRSARPFPFKVFDEPFDALDGRGKELACAWMKQMANERGTVLLMTHSDDVITNAEPDRTWTVVMDADGAHVETD